MNSIPRETIFLQEELLRIDITDKNETVHLGNAIGQLVLQSFKNNMPIRAVCLYGASGTGKSMLADGILQSLEHSEGLELKRRTRKHFFPQTYPKCRHVDYWMWRFNSFARQMLPEYRRSVLQKDEFLLAEWCSEIPKEWLEVDRLDIEIAGGSTIEKALQMRRIPFPGMDEINGLVPPPVWKARCASIAGTGNGMKAVDVLTNEYRNSKEDKFVNILYGTQKHK